jgi:alginate O-acetyltransferase complex protein AlgJ
MRLFKSSGDIMQGLKISRRNAYSYIFAALFFGMLLAPIFKPGWTLKTLGSSFNWRKDLIQMYNFARIKIGDRVFPNVVVGKNGWFFYTGEEAIDDYQRGRLVRQKDLRQIQQTLDNLNRDLAKQGIILVVVIPPNKESVYPQYMPGEIPILRDKSRLDQFMEYMQSHAETRIIDLEPVMKEASTSQQVYFRTDSHWNQYGAYLAYQKILSVLSEEYPALHVHPLSDYQIALGGKTMRDLANIIGVPGIQEMDWVFSPKFSIQAQAIDIPVEAGDVRMVSTEDRTLPSAVIFHDSFFVSLSHFFEPHFSKMTSVPFANQNIWKLSWIKQQNPDIVIIELVERYLWHLPDLLATQ